MLGKDSQPLELFLTAAKAHAEARMAHGRAVIRADAVKQNRRRWRKERLVQMAEPMPMEAWRVLLQKSSAAPLDEANTIAITI